VIAENLSGKSSAGSRNETECGTLREVADDVSHTVDKDGADIMRDWDECESAVALLGKLEKELRIKAVTEAKRVHLEFELRVLGHVLSDFGRVAGRRDGWLSICEQQNGLAPTLLCSCRVQSRIPQCLHSAEDTSPKIGAAFSRHLREQLVLALQDVGFCHGSQREDD
jgi:hypothetical protein